MTIWNKFEIQQNIIQRILNHFKLMDKSNVLLKQQNKLVKYFIAFDSIPTSIILPGL